MIEVKLHFPDQKALLAFFAGTAPLVTADEKVAVAGITADKQVTGGKPQTNPAGTRTAAATEPANTETAAASPSSPKAGGRTTSTTSSPKENESSQETFDYPAFRAKVAKLAEKDRQGAVNLMAAFKVKTFKDLAPELLPEALKAVEAALVEVA